MTLSERLSEYVRACFTGIWVRSFEHDDAHSEIARLCHANKWTLATRDADPGLGAPGHAEETTVVTGTDPLAAIKSLGMLATAEGTALLIMRNLHRFLGS